MVWKVTISPLYGITTLMEGLTDLSFSYPAALPPPFYSNMTNLDAVVPDIPYQSRIQENINTTRAEIAIFALQRNESGGYEIDLTNKKFQSTSDRVTVQVQCK